MMSAAATDRGADVADLHQTLVAELIANGGIRSPAVAAAFWAVPRHVFLPAVDLAWVYSDCVIPTKRLDNADVVSASSQPTIMALMLEQLDLKPGQHVLEIGTGTGYNAALMAQIVGESGQVISLEIDADLVASAREHLTAAGFPQVQVVCADGACGYLAAAPYDRIILTVGAWDLVPAWREQLRLGGRLVLPLALTWLSPAHLSIAFEKTETYLLSRSVKPCAFMSLRGAAEWEPGLIPLGSEAGLWILVERRRAVEAEAVYQLLSGPRRDVPTGLRVTRRELYASWDLWLALPAADFCFLAASGAWLKRDVVPPLVVDSEQWCGTVGVLEGAERCAVLLGRPHPAAGGAGPAATPLVDLYLRSFGPDDTLAQRLLKRMAAWDAAGRPGAEQLAIRAYTAESAHCPAPHEGVVCKPATQLVLAWPPSGVSGHDA